MDGSLSLEIFFNDKMTLFLIGLEQSCEDIKISGSSSNHQPTWYAEKGDESESIENSLCIIRKQNWSTTSQIISRVTFLVVLPVIIEELVHVASIMKCITFGYISHYKKKIFSFHISNFLIFWVLYNPLIYYIHYVFTACVKVLVNMFLCMCHRLTLLNLFSLNNYLK